MTRAPSHGAAPAAAFPTLLTVTHGLILTSFSEFIRTRLGVTAEPLLAGRRFDAAGVYDDADFTALLRRASELSGDDERELQREFGVFTALRTFASLYPEYYAACPNTRAFLLGVEERIHDLVRAAIPGAHPPRLTVRPLGDFGVVISYTSDRGLCGLAEGLVEGTAAFYGEAITVEHPSCMHRGDSACAFVVAQVSG